MNHYYNEIEPYAIAWLRNLIAAGHLPPGDVDERSIEDVKPEDLKGYGQCHFFAGIGGWPLALRLAGWPEGKPVWTGSCPCQPFSSASMGRVSRKDLWPEWSRIIRVSRLPFVFGEQVVSGPWIDRVCDELEEMDYSVRPEIRPAISVKKDHLRYRFYFAGYAYGHSKPELQVDEETSRLPGNRSQPGSVAQEDGIPSRVGRLRSYGKAIVPQVAAQFIRDFVECDYA